MHLQFFGILLTGLGALGTFLLLAVSIGPLAAAFRADGASTGILALLVVALYAAVGVLTTATGLALRQLKRWSWFVGIGLSVLYLSRYPIGTVVGLYGLWALLSSNGRRAFTKASPEIAGPGER